MEKWMVSWPQLPLMLLTHLYQEHIHVLCIVFPGSGMDLPSSVHAPTCLVALRNWGLQLKKNINHRDRKCQRAAWETSDVGGEAAMYHSWPLPSNASRLWLLLTAFTGHCDNCKNWSGPLPSTIYLYMFPNSNILCSYLGHINLKKTSGLQGKGALDESVWKGGAHL